MSTDEASSVGYYAEEQGFRCRQCGATGDEDELVKVEARVRELVSA
jgi:hypothetical protein